MIEYQQNLDLLRQYEQTDLFSVRVLALAESYGAHGIRVHKETDIQAALDEARTYQDAPTIIEFMIAADEIVLPMVKGGNPMSEMILK